MTKRQNLTTAAYLLAATTWLLLGNYVLWPPFLPVWLAVLSLFVALGTAIGTIVCIYLVGKCAK
jgi:hypothetical protein